MTNVIAEILLLDNNLSITEQEYQDLIAIFSNIANDKSSKLPSKAVFLQRSIQGAIKNKLAGNKFTDIDLSSSLPKPDPTMAKVIRGMFLTFLEQDNGLPGFFKIIKGISSMGFGLGSFSLRKDMSELNYSDIAKVIEVSEAENIEKDQTKLLLELIKSDSISRFNTLKRGTACLILACAFHSIYSALCAIEDKSEKINAMHMKKSKEIILEKFSPQSKELSSLFAQSMFANLFESLFSRESTVLSIFTL